MRKWILLLCLLLATVLPVTAGSGVLTVHFSPYRDAPILLYAVAEQNEQGDFVLTEPFSGCNADLSDTSAQAQTQAAGQLAAWAGEKELTPIQICTPGETGQAVFENLSRGVYLVSAEPFRLGVRVITPNPFLVYLPYVDPDGTAHWFLTAQMKYTEKTDDTTLPDTGAQTLAGAGLLLSAGALFTIRKREKS